jgi:hypothetical protein
LAATNPGDRRYFLMQDCKQDCNWASQLALPLVAMRHWLCEALHDDTQALPCACTGTADVAKTVADANTAAKTAAAAQPRETAIMRDMTISL